MNRVAAPEEIIRRKYKEVAAAVDVHLSPVLDNIYFTLLQGYFNCAYECYDVMEKPGKTESCVQNCYATVLRGRQQFETETEKFLGRFLTSLKDCTYKFESAKWQRSETEAINDFESCVNLSAEDIIRGLPFLAGRLENHFSIRD
ncbi:hypothetical protein OWV82_007069 [Melia azedarach]|uniref:Uncharacterized protein n=1 Tax=Melia azedarach TaxID=155640 RepID=A0ACC1YM78_MELAZ|nr:hypothetical protein OWV82_007069 [Melia azedarach]